jgi:DNA repair ATPase RecN
MIDERFLLAAVNIRRTYIKMLGDLNKYQEKAKETLQMLDTAYKKLDDLENNMKNEKNRKDEGYSPLEELVKVINDIEREGKKLENFTNPINKEIEKLALEEQELYKQICLNHPDLNEDQIVECVKERLLKEKL